jgi:hypothetical protein
VLTRWFNGRHDVAYWHLWDMVIARESPIAQYTFFHLRYSLLTRPIVAVGKGFGPTGFGLVALTIGSRKSKSAAVWREAEEDWRHAGTTPTSRLKACASGLPFPVLSRSLKGPYETTDLFLLNHRQCPPAASPLRWGK